MYWISTSQYSILQIIIMVKPWRSKKNVTKLNSYYTADKVV